MGNKGGTPEERHAECIKSNNELIVEMIDTIEQEKKQKQDDTPLKEAVELGCKINSDYSLSDEYWCREDNEKRFEYVIKQARKENTEFTDFEVTMMNLMWEYGCIADKNYEFDSEYKQLVKEALKDQEKGLDTTLYDKLIRRKLEIEQNEGWRYTKHPSEMTDIERFGMEILDPEEEARLDATGSTWQERSQQEIDDEIESTKKLAKLRQQQMKDGIKIEYPKESELPGMKVPEGFKDTYTHIDKDQLKLILLDEEGNVINDKGEILEKLEFQDNFVKEGYGENISENPDYQGSDANVDQDAGKVQNGPDQSDDSPAENNVVAAFYEDIHEYNTSQTI